MIQDDGGLHGGSADRTGPKGNQQSLKWLGPDAVRRVRWNRVNQRSSPGCSKRQNFQLKDRRGRKISFNEDENERRVRANECLFTWSGSNQVNHSLLLGIAIGHRPRPHFRCCHAPYSVRRSSAGWAWDSPRFSSTEFKRFFTHINCQSYL